MEISGKVIIFDSTTEAEICYRVITECNQRGILTALKTGTSSVKTQNAEKESVEDDIQRTHMVY